MMEFDAGGLHDLSYDLKDAPQKIQKLAAVAVKKTAKDIQASAKNYAPVDTGFLRSGITTSDLRSTTGDNPEAEVRASANYAIYQEFGTIHQPGTPFMRPAVTDHEPAFMSAMDQLAGMIL